ncbi:MAG: hypothetical protein E7570_00850 [Ruminococcaceae bacterium]|nr:hypothetical protein [Oscillospiraceae bacterium]
MFVINSNEGYFVHLLKSALKNEQPVEKPDEVEWQKVFEIGLMQNAANLVWFSIEKLNNKPEGELYAQWQEVYAKAASKCFKQMMESEFLADEFTKRGYDILFLKGSKIREYYPSPDMRTMTDIDLLVKSEEREPVRKIMKELDYDEDLMDDGQVDAFKKLPIIYTEIHYDYSNINHAYHDIFSIDWNKLVKTDREHIYEMTYEDLYFFNFGHYVKNIAKVGIGVRTVLDCYVLWNCASEEQKENILKKFENMEFKAFHDNILKIAHIWFDDMEDDGSLDNAQMYLIETSTYGNDKKTQAISLINDERNTESISKTRYILKRIFPGANELYFRFGIKKRIILLLPFLWFARMILLIFSGKEKKENIKQNYSIIESLTPEEVEYERLVRKEFGIL